MTTQALSYVRSREPGDTRPYVEKFAGFIELIADAKARKNTLVIVSQPWVLGDTHAELIESLSRLADAGLTLGIAGR